MWQFGIVACREEVVVVANHSHLPVFIGRGLEYQCNSLFVSGVVIYSVARGVTTGVALVVSVV